MNEKNANEKEHKEQERLHKQFTPMEEEYHAAYPDVKAPGSTAFLRGLLGRYGKGFLVAALIGAAVAVFFWIVFTMLLY
ncbi:tripartite tricarboxylate transporter TctB family protein [Effusibacillus consociatus]|uniref:Tripartite tricarboxylate transporter TctB family protein n=1 Tax=Effusibacillus consociatus TaxID=1117041 RepID=A0ABV9Q6A2_9BACL